MVHTNNDNTTDCDKNELLFHRVKFLFVYSLLSFIMVIYAKVLNSTILFQNARWPEAALG